MKNRRPIFLLVFAILIGFYSFFYTIETATADPAQGDDYEIDYEEEPAATPDLPVVEKKVKLKKQTADVQGSLAKHRFYPTLKFETKSIYKKDGNALDVDSD